MDWWTKALESPDGHKPHSTHGVGFPRTKKEPTKSAEPFSSTDEEDDYVLNILERQAEEAREKTQQKQAYEERMQQHKQTVEEPNNFVDKGINRAVRAIASKVKLIDEHQFEGYPGFDGRYW